MNPFYRNISSMGTRMDVIIPGVDEEKGNKVFRQISDELERMENLLSIYRDDSALSVLNRNAFNRSYIVEKELFSLISQLKGLSRECLGFFDPAFRISKNKNLGSEVFHTISGLSGMDNIILDQENSSIKFLSEKTKIDSGGFGKGYALEKIKNILIEENIYSGFISFGESSVIGIGTHPFGDCWKVSIPDLFSEKSVGIIELKDNSLSVSGNTPGNRNKYPEGHIADPRSGKLVQSIGIICTSGPSAFISEILSTALFAAGNNGQTDIIKNFPGYSARRIMYYNEDKIPEITEICID
jgi:FAD:protein FMN transferase